MNLDPVISFTFSLPNINGNKLITTMRVRGLDGDVIELLVYDYMRPIKNIHV